MTTTKINWKPDGEFSFYGYYRGTMVSKCVGAHGSVFWANHTPAIQYSSEAELRRVLDHKHKAA